MNQELQRNLAAEVKRRKHGRSMTNADLGGQAGVDGATISRLENDKSNVTLDVAAKVSKVLNIRLQDLRKSAPQTFATDAGDRQAARRVSSEDVQLLLDLKGQNPAACDELFVRWLATTLKRVAGIESSSPPAAMLQEQLRLIHADHEVLDYGIRYPRGRELLLLTESYRLGGVLSQEDFALLLSVIPSQSQYFDELDRQGRDALMRLQANKPERVLLIEVERIGDILQIDLLGMYWSTLGLLDRRPDERSDRDALERGRLISLFVLLTGWLQETAEAGEDWLGEVRGELAARQPA